MCFIIQTVSIPFCSLSLYIFIYLYIKQFQIVDRFMNTQFLLLFVVSILRELGKRVQDPRSACSFQSGEARDHLFRRVVGGVDSNNFIIMSKILYQ